MKIVVLDAYHVSQSSLNFDILKDLGELVVYDDTKEDEVLERIVDADIVIENRIKMGKREMDFAKNLKFISTTSTGFNVIDIDYANEKGIKVSNIPAYSTYAVAQSTIALMLECASKTSVFNDFVKTHKWSKEDNQTMWSIKQIELVGKTLGIIGMGDIGSKVSKISEALGMKVLYYKRNADLSYETDNIKYATLDEVLASSDIISLHCPLNESTNRLINREKISKMKDGVILINTARGSIIDEADVLDGLNSGKISHLAVDVLRNEPPKENDPLVNHKNTTITPHVAWAPEDTRLRLLEILRGNVKGFLEGNPQNLVSNE